MQGESLIGDGSGGLETLRNHSFPYLVAQPWDYPSRCPLRPFPGVFHDSGTEVGSTYFISPLRTAQPVGSGTRILPGHYSQKPRG